MEPYPLLLAPVFKERIWGGKWLATEFGYPLPSDHTGECWAISAHPHGTSSVGNGPLSGFSLTSVWHRFPEWFADSPPEEFPLLIKLIDAADDLSVQVHPDDRMARLLENEPNGKTECWYVLDAEPGAQIVYGHRARSLEDLAARVYAGEWDELLRRESVEKGDFVFVPAGTVHALGKGVRVLEVQQSSDVTYRLYDYDRKEKGKPRPLHIEQALKAARVPSDHRAIVHSPQGVADVSYASGSYFQVSYHHISDSQVSIFHAPGAVSQDARLTEKNATTEDLPCLFRTISVLCGSGDLQFSQTEGEKRLPLQKGDHVLLPGRMKEAVLSGALEWITTSVPMT